MADPLQHVQPGDRLAENITADGWNRMIDAARAVLDIDIRHVGLEGLKPDTGVVLVRNTTDDDLDQFDILSIDQGPIIGPNESRGGNENEFRRRVTFDGDKVLSHYSYGLFSVLLEPIAAGKLGRAVVSGVAICRLSVADEDDTHADFHEYNYTTLRTTKTGTARIMWRDRSGEDEEWAIVRLGDPSAFGVITDTNNTAAHAVRKAGAEARDAPPWMIYNSAMNGCPWSSTYMPWIVIGDDDNDPAVGNRYATGHLSGERFKVRYSTTCGDTPQTGEYWGPLPGYDTIWPGLHGFVIAGSRDSEAGTVFVQYAPPVPAIAQIKGVIGNYNTQETSRAYPLALDGTKYDGAGDYPEYEIGLWFPGKESGLWLNICKNDRISYLPQDREFPSTDYQFIAIGYYRDGRHLDTRLLPAGSDPPRGWQLYLITDGSVLRSYAGAGSVQRWTSGETLPQINFTLIRRTYVTDADDP